MVCSSASSHGRTNREERSGLPRLLALMRVRFNKVGRRRRRGFGGGSGLTGGLALGALEADFWGVFFIAVGGWGTTGRVGWGVSVCA